MKQNAEEKSICAVATEKHIMPNEFSGKAELAKVIATKREQCEQETRERARRELNQMISHACAFAKGNNGACFFLSDKSTMSIEFTIEGHLDRLSSANPVIVVQFCGYANRYRFCSADMFKWYSDNTDMIEKSNVLRILDEEFSSFFKVETGIVEFTTETSSVYRQIFKKSVAMEF